MRPLAQLERLETREPVEIAILATVLGQTPHLATSVE